jgi:hypothetical protein
VHDDNRHRVLAREQVAEFDEALRLQRAQDGRHVLAHRQFLAADPVMLGQLGAAQYIEPGALQVPRIDIGQRLDQALFDEQLGPDKVAAFLRHIAQCNGGRLDLFIVQQTTHQLGARVACIFDQVVLALGQQHARLDFDQHCRHQQVFRRQLEIALADLFDIDEVLQGDLRHRDIEDIEVLPPDQVQQQIERPFKCVKKDLERIRRDIQVSRQARERFAVQACQGGVDRRRMRCVVGGLSGLSVYLVVPVSRPVGHHARVRPQTLFWYG